MGASPRSASPDLALAHNRGVNPQKGTHRREVLSTLPIPEVAAPFDRL